MQTFKILALTCSGLALSVNQAYANDATSETKLDKQVVTATSNTHDLFTAPASITLLEGDELRAQNHATIADALADTTGVSLQTGPYGRQDIRIRGMESSYSLVLIDGQRTSSSNALIRGNDFDLSSFPMGIVERIEVILGPMSSLYGSDALGGVINIITKKTIAQADTVNVNTLSMNRVDQTWSAGIDTEFTQQQEGDGGDQQRISAYATGAIIPNRLSTTVAVESSERDAWKPYDGIYAPLDGLEENKKTSAKMDLDYRINNDQSVAVNVGVSTDDRKAQTARGATLATTTQETERLSTSLQHSGQWNWGQSQAKVLHETIDITDASDLYARDTRTENGTAIAKQTNIVVDALANTNIGSHLVSVGTQVRQTELTSDRDLPDGDSVNEVALFVQDEWFVSDVTLTAGVRAENHEDYGTYVSPRAYAVYETGNGIIIKGGVGSGFKAPDLVQTSKEYTLLSCGGACYLTGNPDLDPETNTAYEVSVAFNDAQLGVSSGLFYNEVKDKLFRDTSVAAGSFNGVPTIQYINLDKAIYQGAELEAWFDVSNNLSLSANYTFTDAKDDTTHARLTYVPLQQSDIKVSYAPIEAIKTFVKYRFIGQQELSAGRAPSYNIIDLGAQFNAYQGVKIKLGVNNVENVVLEDESNVFATGASYVEQGRSIYAGLNYEF